MGWVIWATKKAAKGGLSGGGDIVAVLGGGLIAAAPHFLLQECPAQPNPGAGPRRQEHPSRIIASGIPCRLECAERPILATSEAGVLPQVHKCRHKGC